MRKANGAFLTAVAVLVASASPVQSQASRVAASPEAIDAVFARYDSDTTPGCSVAVIDQGRVIFSNSYGMADPALGVPMTSRTTTWIPYSEARVFVALAVAMLAQEGRLRLEDPVRRHVPEVPAYAAEVTVRQLIHHTSGLADYGVLAGPGWDLPDRLSEDEFFRMLSRWGALVFVPGQDEMYSNTDYALLKILVERVTGGTLHEYLATQLFEPRGMASTRIGFDQSRVVRDHALFHERDGEGFRRVLGYRVSPVGQIAVTTNLDDLVRFDAALRDPMTGLAALLENLKEGAPASNNGEPGGYAFGLHPGVQSGLPLVQFQGVGDFAYLVQARDSSLSVATLCNAYSGMGSFGAQVARLHFDWALESQVQTATEPTIEGPSIDTYPLPVAEMQPFVGEYRDTTGGTIVDVQVVDDRLIMGVRGGPPFPALRAIDASKFETTAGGVLYLVEFQRVDGEMVVTTWDRAAEEPGGPPLRRFNPWRPATESLPDYVGTYVGERIEAIFHIRADGDRLLLATSGMAEAELSPMNEIDLFRLPDGYRFRFERDAGGTVVAVNMDSTRVRGMRLARRDRDTGF